MFEFIGVVNYDSSQVSYPPPISGSLPSGYVALDYVQGRERPNPITTDVIFSQTDSVFVDFELTSTPITYEGDYNAEACCIYGMFYPQGTFGFRTIFRGLNYGNPEDGGISTPKLVYRDYSNLSLGGKVININGVGRYKLSLCSQLILDGGVSMFTEDLSVVSIPLSFLYWYSGSVTSISFIRLYRCAIVALDGTTTHDFLPCENPSGEEGLYDVVGRAFYGFSTT